MEDEDILLTVDDVKDLIHDFLREHREEVIDIIVEEGGTVGLYNKTIDKLFNE